MRSVSLSISGVTAAPCATTSERCVIFFYTGNRHGLDGNCLLHRPLWRAFFIFPWLHHFLWKHPKKGAGVQRERGGVWIQYGTWYLMRSPLGVKLDQWNKIKKAVCRSLLWPRLRRQSGGPEGGRGLTVRNSLLLLPLHLLLFSFVSLYSVFQCLTPWKQNKLDKFISAFCFLLFKSLVGIALEHGPI